MIENSKGKTVNPAVVEHMAMENEKLRGLLRLATDRWESWASEIINTTPEYESELAEIARIRAALSQQADPVEPATAQDERVPTPADYLAARSALESCDWRNTPLGTKAILGRVIDLLWLAAQATRPAQTEQQPLTGKRLHEMWVSSSGLGYEPWDAVAYSHQGWNGLADRLNATPVAQTAPKIAAKMPCGTAVTNVYEAYEAGKRAAAPQPEQSGLVEALPYQTLFNAIAAATKSIAGTSHISISVAAFRAALSAQRGEQ